VPRSHRSRVRGCENRLFLKNELVKRAREGERRRERGSEGEEREEERGEEPNFCISASAMSACSTIE
jgi:hypothetical protein